MLSVEELKKQNTFFPYINKNGGVTEWYTSYFEYQIKLFENGNFVLSHHCEIDGSTWNIKKLKSLDDLKDIYEAITGKEFK